MQENTKHIVDAWNMKARNYPRFKTPAKDTLEILDFFRANGANFDSKSIIDIGCGNGRFSLVLYKEAKEVLGVDSAQEMLNFLQEDANALGANNISTACAKWEDFTPTQTFDIAFASMTPAMNNKQGVQKALEICKECFCYVGWGRYREAPFTNAILQEHNLELLLPTGLPEVLKWLGELNYKTPPHKFMESSFLHKSSVEKTIEDMIFNVRVHNGVPNEKLIAKYVRSQAKNGEVCYTHKREIGIAYIAKDSLTLR